MNDHPGVDNADPELIAAQVAVQKVDNDDRMAAYQARYAAFEGCRAEILPANRAALFASLAQAGIDTVIVTFDGSGDSGQIENIDAFASDESAMALPGSRVEFKEVVFETTVVTSRLTPVHEVIETMAYDFLADTHAGWENDDRAYGEFRLVVPERTITLDYNERFTDSTNYQHEL